MTDARNKYSLWLVPTGKSGESLRALVDDLAETYATPKFVPHLTLVAAIYASASELEAAKRKIETLAQKGSCFTIEFTGYGYTDEEFRSLFLVARSKGLESMYQLATEAFPQISSEHFQAMPHLSVLYGSFPTNTKQEIITAHPLPVTECVIESFDLFLTDGPVASWRLEQQFSL